MVPRAVLPGAVVVLLLLMAATITGSGQATPHGRQVVSASPQAVSAVPKAPEALPSATATAISPKPVPSPVRVAAVVPQPVASPAVRSVTNSPLTVNRSGTGNSGVALTVRSTAYCEVGKMASGALTYWGAVAMAEPFGSRWLVLSGPLAGGVFTAEDRYGWGTQFDVAMPGECGRARMYGLRVIQVVRVG